MNEPADGLTFWTLPDAACAALPELRAAIRADVARYVELLGKPPHPHVILEEHLLPFLVAADAEGNEDALRRGFALLESVAAHPDEDLVGALGHAFLDHVDPLLFVRHHLLVGDHLRRCHADWRRRPTPEE